MLSILVQLDKVFLEKIQLILKECKGVCGRGVKLRGKLLLQTASLTLDGVEI